MGRPRRAPDLEFHRPADGALVEVWTRSGHRRSKDRVVHGTQYFRAVVCVDGALVWEDAQRHATAEEALDAVRAMFPEGATP